MNSPVIAVISKEWKQRMKILSLALVAMGGWFLFDGAVGYPKHNVKAGVYEELVAKYGKDTPEVAKAWAAAAAERKWAPDKPKASYNADQIRTQFILGFVVWLGAAACLFHYFKSLPLTTRLDGDVITLPDGRKIALDKIRALSKKRWENKGIADLAYEAAQGKITKFILDDYKYIGAAQILEAAEKSLAPAEDPPVPDGESPSS